MTNKTTIEFEIPVEARSTQFGGKRLSTRGNRPRFFRDKKAQAYIDELTLRCRPFAPKEPLTGPLELEVMFVIPRPKRICRKKDPEGMLRVDVRPDSDNYAKVLADTLTACGFWVDDGQVSDAIYRKRYHEKAGKPRIRIRITTQTYE